ncbi:uncharacterized protein [Montipora foliosa]|uniref:uncharacterized protein n=1 Tax=Montipora foliosa TaxID=591990 RepID=UPI0035F179B1
MSAPGEQASGSTTSTTPTDPGGATVKQVLDIDIHGLPHFDLKGEPNSLYVRWKRWKRAFNLYVASKGVTNEGQKIALLLHSGGMELQEIYYTLVPEDNETTFNNCLAALDNYFTPKVDVPFERHVFRQMQQTEGKTIDQFVCRLHQKAISCDFANADEAIRDQIIEKCKDSRLRRKFLEKASDATLSVLQETARVHEAVNTQMQSMGACCRSKVENKRPGEKPRSDGANQIPEEPEENYYAFVVKCGGDLSGVADLCIGGVQLKDVFINSGATCNIVDRDTWESLKQEERCVAAFTAAESHGRALLGRDTAEKLNVLRVGPPNSPQANSIKSEGTSVDIVKNFPDVFTGVGKWKDYQLKLHVNKDVKPVAQPVRRLPFGLREKVDKELDELLKEDIIEKVPNGPTGWVSPLVVVPKPDGDIRICVDMRRANEAIERESHPIPTNEEVLHDLNGSTVFSKLDLKWGFHQVELYAESRQITTFITHRGLFRYKRLMFGITSAPEKYQNIFKDALIGCKGIKNIVDDLIIHGCGIQEHDENLLDVLCRLRKCGLTLNEKKCQFRLPKLTFLGHNCRCLQFKMPSHHRIPQKSDRF